MADIPLSPVTSWNLMTIPSIGAIAVNFRFLASPMESLEQAHQSPSFVMHIAQLRELAHAMLEAADKAEAAGGLGSGFPKN